MSLFVSLLLLLLLAFLHQVHVPLLQLLILFLHAIKGYGFYDLTHDFFTYVWLVQSSLFGNLQYNLFHLFFLIGLFLSRVQFRCILLKIVFSQCIYKGISFSHSQLSRHLSLNTSNRVLQAQLLLQFIVFFYRVYQFFINV